MINFEDALVLLKVADLSLKWPQLKPLHDAAIDGLKKMQMEPEEEPAPEAEKPPGFLGRRKA